LIDDEPDPGREPGPHPESGSFLLLFALLVSAASPAVLLIVAGGCLLLGFFCSVFEAALSDYSRVKLAAHAKKDGLSDAFDAVLLHEDDILFASKVSRGLFQTVGIAVAAVVFFGTAPGTLQTILVAVAFATFFMVFLVGAPYVLGTRLSENILLRWLLPYARVVGVVRPVTSALERFAARLIGAKHEEADPVEEIADDILSAAEEGAAEGALEHTEKRMIEGILDMREVAVDHIMTPRTEMISVAIDVDAKEAMREAARHGLSRLPVYRETADEIVGVLYVKDLLPFLGEDHMPAVATTARKPLFVPQSKNVAELLQEMRAKRVHLAIVLDEYGGTAGVVTIEDILEEIVGEIEDEHEASPQRSDVVVIDENAATVEGRTHIDDLNRSMDLEVPESEEYETVGGLLFCRMGRVPVVGEHYDVNGIRFTILEADERRVNRVKVAVQSRAG
jgi:CBS domain containing-hemolysin-like protein